MNSYLTKNFTFFAQIDFIYLLISLYQIDYCYLFDNQYLRILTEV